MNTFTGHLWLKLRVSLIKIVIEEHTESITSTVQMSLYVCYNFLR